MQARLETDDGRYAHVGDLPTQHGQIHAQRSLARAGYSHQYDLCLGQVIEALAIVVGDAELDGSHPLEVALALLPVEARAAGRLFP